MLQIVTHVKMTREFRCSQKSTQGIANERLTIKAWAKNGAHRDVSCYIARRAAPACRPIPPNENTRPLRDRVLTLK